MPLSPLLIMGKLKVVALISHIIGRQKMEPRTNYNISILFICFTRKVMLCESERWVSTCLPIKISYHGNDMFEIESYLNWDSPFTHTLLSLFEHCIKERKTHLLLCKFFYPINF